jgi:lysozyme
VENVKQQLIRYEGLKLEVYKCPAGYQTIGVGRNLESKGISEKEAMVLLDNDIAEFTFALEETYDWFEGLGENRQAVIINMAFNLGMSGLGKFKNMISAIENSDWEEAASQMMDSKWATQVGRRAEELSEAMKEG